jgi:1-deoxy-D-xylulose-5-phosphate synthase
LSPIDLPQVCQELRDFLIEHISRTGGHLGAGLGVVELTLALHYVFNTPTDNIVFDVGHQAYPHKVITGRRDFFTTIRQKDGLSGFPKISESVYDSFGTGHASTSISAALGMSFANEFLDTIPNINSKSKNIAVIGDGSLTGGLAFEGLNNAGFSRKDLLVILNDNNISIDNNISAISNYFNTLYSSYMVQSIKDNI